METVLTLPIDLDIVAKGMRYSKEFGAFLKETYGDISSDLPYYYHINGHTFEKQYKPEFGIRKYS